MAEFIGLQMLVTLRDPPVRLKGTVSAVVAGSGLTLSNVWMLETNQWQPNLVVPSSNILDLSEITATPPVPQVPANATGQLPTPIEKSPGPLPQPQPPLGLVDPAIVSVARAPVAVVQTAAEAHQLPNTSEKRDPEPVVVVPAVVIPTAQVESTTATPTTALFESFKGLRLDGVAAAGPAGEAATGAAEAALEYEQVSNQEKKGRRRPRKGVESSPAPSAKAAGKGKGWRQTPILQSTAAFQPFKSLKKGSKSLGNADNGWASEDVTDVQEMGDFDFEGSLAKFDKQNLFEQMRQADQVDDADRLVSHNRLPRPKPGTAGGKNLHYSENVLERPTILKPPRDSTAPDFWNSEADDGIVDDGDRVGGRETTGMGSRQGSRRGEGKRAESKVSTSRRSQSRKASTTAAPAGPARVNSGLPLAASTAALPLQGLYVRPEGRRIETVSALQMLNLETIAHNEIGLTEEMMTENAGRGIAEVTLNALADPAIKVRHAGSVDATGNPPPQTVVVLAGNNKSGARAVAAARHLRNKGVNVITCVVGLERGERDLLEDMRQQVRLYKNLGGRVFTKTDFFEHLRKISIPMLTIDTPRSSLSSLANPAPVMLIIDALLGLAISFDELRGEDQATVYQLIDWANRNEAFVLSIDMPTGIDPTTGRVSVVDGNRLYVKPRHVVAVGAPKKGLLEALAAVDSEGDGDTVRGDDIAVADEDALDEWKLWLVDMGLGPAVWKKAGTKLRRGIEFGGRWVLELEYRGEDNGDTE